MAGPEQHPASHRRRVGGPSRRAWAALLALVVVPGLLVVTGPPTAHAASNPTPTTSPSGARLTTLPAPPGARGRWSVTVSAAGPLLRWRSPTPIPVMDSRPEMRADGQLLAYPTLSDDRRTLSVPLAALGDIPASRVQVWLGMRRLDSLTQPTPQATAPRVTPSGPSPDATDPATPGPYAVRSFEYRAADLPWPQFQEPMEVLGHVELPVGLHQAPLVLFLHGRHLPCYGDWDGEWPCGKRARPVPSYLGYGYLQRMLASQGYATVSLSANAINAQDGDAIDGGAQARAALVLHHLDLLARWNADSSYGRFHDLLDLTHVVLVGHSRGGEGVDQAAIDGADGSAFSFAGQVLIAPTDFGFQTAPYLPTELLLGYCDGDVFDLQGQRYVDAAHELAPDDTSLRSAVLLLGANHNYFNTQWTPGVSVAPAQDDWSDRRDPVCGRSSPQRLTAAEQRRAAKTFVAAGVHAFVGDGRRAALSYLDAGGSVAVPAAGAVAYTSALGGRRVTNRVDDGAQVVGSAQACAAATPVGDWGAKRAELPLCGNATTPRQPHWVPSDPVPPSVHAAYAGGGLLRDFELTWTRPGGRGGLTFRRPLSLIGRHHLDLRTVVGGQGPVEVRVVLRSGDRQWAGPVRHLEPLPGAGVLRTRWAQTLRVDPDAYRDHVDLSRVDTVLLQPVNDAGRLWVLDVSAVGPGLAPVPDRSLPRVTFGQLVQPEGDAEDPVALLPLHISGAVTRPATLALAAQRWTFQEETSTLLTVTLRPGQSGAAVAVPYEADTLDDLPLQRELVFAAPRTGVVTSGFAGAVDIRDDDPTPHHTLEGTPASVAYGEPVVFRVTLSAPVDYYLENRVRALRSTQGPSLRTSDVPRRWLVHQTGDAPADSPLWRVWDWGWVDLAPGDVEASITVPTRPHPLHLVTKWLTVRFSAEHVTRGVVATVRVVMPEETIQG